MASDMHDGERSYQAYVLRLWREAAGTDDTPAVWRFSLDDTATGQRFGFSNLSALIEYLGQQLGESFSPKDVRSLDEAATHVG